jgi:hypothetical protein
VAAGWEEVNCGRSGASSGDAEHEIMGRTGVLDGQSTVKSAVRYFMEDLLQSKELSEFDRHFMGFLARLGLIVYLSAIKALVGIQRNIKPPAPGFMEDLLQSKDLSTLRASFCAGRRASWSIYCNQRTY